MAVSSTSSMAPDFSLYLPLGQSKQAVGAVLPTSDEYRPGPHARQVLYGYATVPGSP